MTDKQQQDFSAFGILKPADSFIVDFGKGIMMRSSLIYDNINPFDFYKLWTEQQFRITTELISHNFGTIDVDNKKKVRMMSFGSQGNIETHLHKPYRFVVTSVDGRTEGSMMNSYAIALVKECQLVNQDNEKPRNIEDVIGVRVISYYVPAIVTDVSASQVTGLGIICPNGKYSKLMGVRKEGVMILPSFSKEDQNMKRLNDLVKYIPEGRVIAGAEPEIKAHIRSAINPYLF